MGTLGNEAGLGAYDAGRSADMGNSLAVVLALS